MNRRGAAFVVALGIASTGPARAGNDTALSAATPERQLTDGRRAYERGDYAGAVRTLTPLLYPSIELTNVDSVIDAHRLLALSYLLQKKELEAEEEASAILALRPSFELDPIIDPPTAVAFFDGVRKKQDARLRELRGREIKEAEARKQEEERRKRAQAERIYIQQTVKKNSRLLATVPFGVGQWQNGQPRELVFGALSLAAYVALDQKYSYDPARNKRLYPSDERTTAQALVGLQLGAGIAFWATLVWGIIDAHVLYKPQTLVDTHELPRKSALKSLDLAPIIDLNRATGQVGIAVQGAF